MDNFSNAELDALYRLAMVKGKPSHITADSYSDLNRNVTYGDEKATIGEYLSPLRSVGTTIGQATVRDGVIKDIYDFNTRKKQVTRYPDGQFLDEYGVPTGTYNEKDYKDAIFGSDDKKFKPESTYQGMRHNLLALGHTSSDPDNQKIRTEIKIQDIKDKLGKKLGKYDIYKNITRRDFIKQIVMAGMATGAPIGLLLGTTSGLIKLIDKKNRKKWIKTLLVHSLGGAAIGAAVGGIGGGFAGGKMHDKMNKGLEKKSMSRDGVNGDNNHEDYILKTKKNRVEKIKSAIINTLAYTAPLAMLGLAAIPVIPAYKKAVKVKNGLFDDMAPQTGIELQIK